MNMNKDDFVTIYLKMKLHNDKKEQVKRIIVNKTLTVAQLLIFIRNKVKLKSEQAMFIIVNDAMPVANQMIGEIYDQYKNKDDCLDLLCLGENCFGS